MLLRFLLFLLYLNNYGSSNKSYQKLKDRKQHNTHYDSLYGALIYLSDYPIPLTKHRISTNKNVLSSLLSKQLINPVISRIY